MYKEMICFSRDQADKPEILDLNLNLWPYTSVAGCDSILDDTHCVVFLPFPVSIPYFPTSIFQYHIPNKVIALKSCSRSALGGSKLKHSSALFFLLSFHFLNFCSGPKKTTSKEWFHCDTFKTPPLFLKSWHMHDQIFLQDWYFLWPLSSPHGFYPD